MAKQVINTEQIISEVTESISSTSTQEEVSSIVWSFCKRFGVENFVFGASLYNNLRATPEFYTISGYPDEWQKRYEEKGYFNEDLTVSHCLTKHTPIIWPLNDKSISTTNKQIFSEASEFGINSGVSFPYHGAACEFAGFGISTSDTYQHSELRNPDTQFAMQVIGASLFDHLKTKSKKENTNTLTAREKECLKWVAAGKTSWETSIIMGISERTVIFHVTNAATKMGTTSRTNAAIIALMNGEI